MLSPIFAQATGYPMPAPLTQTGLHPALVTTLVGLIGLLIIVILVLTGINQWKQAFGRKPTIDVSLAGKADKGELEKVSLDIQGFALAKDLDGVREEHRLRALGLEKQISESRHQWREEFGAWQNFARERDEERNGRLRHLEQQLALAAQALAKLDERSVGIAGQISNVAQKLDRNIERATGRA